jgi:hypothetical protein
MTTYELRAHIDDTLDVIQGLEFELKCLRDSSQVDEDYKLEWESNKKITKEFFEELRVRARALRDFAYSEASPL